ncbi:MAG: hypothetical protein GY756_03945 [bacterium]|nr:hypothetical protein [bacterium]
MKRINFFPSIYTPEESNSMSKQALTALIERFSINEDLETAYTDLDTENNNLTKVLNSALTNPNTEQFNKDVMIRDTILVGGRNNIKSFLNWIFDLEKKEAAEKLNEVFERHYAEMHSLSYQSQSSVSNSLIKDFSEADKQANLATLNLTVWYGEYVKSQENVEKIYNKKVAYDKGRESLAKKEAQIPVNDKLENLFTLLNTALIFKSQDPVWEEIVIEMEGIVDRVNITARNRRNHNSNKNDDNNEETS